ncbi:MAG: galactokinase [Saprospiraceae bacterium]
MNDTTIQAAFIAAFGERPEVSVRAPGRVNLIGEHTDYNGGFVLPAAIDRAIWLSASRRLDGRFAFFAADLNAHFLSENSDTVFQYEHTWTNYLLGIISEARKDGLYIGGLNIVFGGDIPIGAGLSSSAALESGMLFATNELYRLGLSKLDIVRLAQRGENNFVGMKCGIMDMFASVMGRAGNVVRLDCRNLDFEYFPFVAPEHSLVLFDSGVKHTLVDSEYNTRRAECEAGVAVLQQFDPNVSSLRDVSPDFLIKHCDALHPIIFRRCKFIVEEIARVGEACFALQNDDLERLGQLMFQCHDGLNLEYEVCVPQTNFLVEQARHNRAVVGARQMGGGFGGCTINLVKTNSWEQFAEETAMAYRQKFGFELNVYPIRLTGGVEQVQQ